MRPTTKQAYKLLHDGGIALSHIEANGMRIDERYLHHAIKSTNGKIKRLTEEIKKDKIYRIWRRTYGEKTNLGSHQQLGKVLFTVMDYPAVEFTKTGRPKTDIHVLEKIDLDFVRNFLGIERLKKAVNTYLKGILRETVDGYLHPFFNLHLARTYRGSSDSPNFKNIPVRVPEIAKLIRRCFIPRKNHVIAEIDYSGAEICGAVCYHKDPRMITYIKEKKDLHRDMAMQCYMLRRSQVNKDIRYCGKNMFVFPQFYGDYYVQCSKSLWEAIGLLHLKTVDGLNLRKHLKNQGIRKLGRCDPDKRPVKDTFERHIQEVEYRFWNKKFKVYNQWKKDWWESYLRTGGFDMLTGFHIEGFYERNNVINYPIQGTSFHFLLWSLIQIVQWMIKSRMKSLIVGEIYDSIVGDIHKKELDDYLSMAKHIMTELIRKHWHWIIVPLTVETEVAPEGKSWYRKEEVKI